MKKDEIIERLCGLCSDVSNHFFNNEFSHDCFCESNANPNFQFDERIIEFIEKTIYEKFNSK